MNNERMKRGEKKSQPKRNRINYYFIQYKFVCMLLMIRIERKKIYGEFTRTLLCVQVIVNFKWEQTKRMK